MTDGYTNIIIDFTDEEYAMIEAAAKIKSETPQQFCERAVAELVARLRTATQQKEIANES